ncbi:MAG: glycosyltransferase family 2 protein [Candidatus Binatus sp.]|uniref:glycosyltransferase family 2 protein n=1 Tax=Candidatus Binatus sp. TaxID=2811406 RepID=UPI003BAEB44D
MFHWQLIVLSSILVLLTLPGTIELAMITIAGMLPSRDPLPNAIASTIGRLAIVIPAHNEATSIVRCVRSVGACMLPDSVETEIVVVADNCTDATADLARGANARVLVRSDSARRGKGFALRFAFETLLDEGFDAVVVVDADSVVDSNLLLEVVRLFRMGADGVQVRYVVLNPDDSTRTRLMNVAFMAFNVLRARGRARMNLSVGIFGNGFGLSRATLKAVPYDSQSLVEDLEYHLRLVQAGKKIVFVDRARVRAEMPTGGRGASTQRARWEGGRLRTALENLPRLLGGVISGKSRLLEPMLELLLLPLAFHITLLGVIALMPFVVARIYALLALALVAFHVVVGILVGGGDWRDFSALLSAPFYVAWKLATLPKTVQSARSVAPWVRTER